MDPKAFRALSYGVYVITSQVEGSPGGLCS